MTFILYYKQVIVYIRVCLVRSPASELGGRSGKGGARRDAEAQPDRPGLLTGIGKLVLEDP